MIKILSISLFVLFFCCGPAYANSVAGVEFVDSVELKDGSALTLNGAGIRSKWFVQVYAAGLYLPEPSSDVDKILAMPGPKRIHMHFLHKKVSKEKLLASLEQGFQANHTPEELNTIANEIAELKKLFKTVRKGDDVILEYSPTMGTQVFFNEELQGVIPGFTFHQAMLRVWLGEQPADQKLKQRLLGKDG